MIGAENVYTCPICHGYTVTIDRAEGVTPFMLDCRASGKPGDCNGKAESSFYPKGPRPKHIPAPSWEWYKPEADEYKFLSGPIKDHVDMGGLLLRKIGGGGEEELPYDKIVREHLGHTIKRRRVQ